MSSGKQIVPKSQNIPQKQTLEGVSIDDLFSVYK